MSLTKAVIGMACMAGVLLGFGLAKEKLPLILGGSFFLLVILIGFIPLLDAEKRQ